MMMVNNFRHTFCDDEQEDIDISLGGGTFIAIRTDRGPGVHIGFFDDNSFPENGAKIPLSCFRIDEFLTTIQKTQATFNLHVNNINVLMVSGVVRKDKIDYIRNELETIYGSEAQINFNTCEYQDIISGANINGNYNIPRGNMRITGTTCTKFLSNTSIEYEAEKGYWS